MVRRVKPMTLVGHTYAVPQKYAHIDFKPPKGAQEAAARALRKRADAVPSQRGMTPVGLARAEREQHQHACVERESLPPARPWAA